MRYRGFHGPSRQMRDDFSNGLGRVDKKEISFPTDWAKKKGKLIILQISPGCQNEDKVFKLVKKIIMYRTQAKTNVCVFQFSLQDYKHKSIRFLYYYY